MADETTVADQAEESVETPAEETREPAYTKADIDRLMAENEERIKGLQRVIAKKDQEYAEEIESLKTAGLSEDEREQRLADRLKAENEELKTQLELAELAREYGDEMPYFNELLGADTAEDQLKVMRKVLRAAQQQKARSESEGEKPEDANEVPDVDRNNPRRKAPEGMLLPDGTVMTDELADSILKSIDRQADVTQPRR